MSIKMNVQRSISFTHAEVQEIVRNHIKRFYSDTPTKPDDIKLAYGNNGTGGVTATWHTTEAHELLPLPAEPR